MNFYILIKIIDWLIMAKITLKNLSHSYLSKQNSDIDWALRGVNIDEFLYFDQNNRLVNHG